MADVSFRIPMSEGRCLLCAVVLIEDVLYSFTPEALQGVPGNLKINFSPEIAPVLSTLPVLPQT